jgi:hypothetical protein
MHLGRPVTDRYCNNASAIVVETVVQSTSARGALREHGAPLPTLSTVIRHQPATRRHAPVLRLGRSDVGANHGACLLSRYCLTKLRIALDR